MKKFFLLITLLLAYSLTQAPPIHAESASVDFCNDGGYRVEDNRVFYCRDGYEPEVEMLQVDSSSFKILSNYPNLVLAKDKNAVYCSGDKINADSNTVELIGESYYFKDKNSVFFDCKKLENSHPSTFKIIDNGFFGQDKNQVYHREVTLDLNVNTLKIYGQGYLGDDEKIFYNEWLVPEADPLSFKLIDPKDDYLYCGDYEINAMDSINYYSDFDKVCDKSFGARVSSFLDLSVKTDYISEIVWTLEQGVTKGYENGKWGPDDCVTRAQTAKMLLEDRFGKAASTWNNGSIERLTDFPDVLKTDWHYNYIHLAHLLKIIEGYPNGNFNPDQCVNRVEAMKMAVNSLIPGEAIVSQEPLSYWRNGPVMVDMDPTAWYAPYARVLFNSGWVGSKHTRPAKMENGFSQDYLNFFPSEPMSRKEFAYMLSKIEGVRSYFSDFNDDLEDLLSPYKIKADSPFSSTYYSEVSQKTFPYFYIETSQNIQPQGLFIYLHGAGGGYEQGMSETNYSGNFKNLKEVLKNNNFVYATPATSGFGVSGGKDVVEFMRHLRSEYGQNLPIYLSGASAGGSTIFYALNENIKSGLEDPALNIQGVVFVVPAVSTSMIDEMNWGNSNLKVWIEAGEKDGVFPPDRVTYFKKALTDKGYSVESNIISGGDHNAPVEQIDWVKVLGYLRG